jgi:hypothetical protein
MNLKNSLKFFKFAPKDPSVILMEVLMKFLTAITTSLSVLLVSCGDKTTFSSNGTDASPSTEVSRKSAGAAGERGDFRGTLEKEDLEGSSQKSAPDVAQSVSSSPSVESEQHSSTSVVPTETEQSTAELPTTAKVPTPVTPSESVSLPKTSLPVPESSPAPKPDTMAAQVSLALKSAVAAEVQSAGGTLTLAQAQGLQAGLAALSADMLQGADAAPAVFAKLLVLVGKVKGQKLALNGASTVQGALPIGLPIPAALPNVAALADVAAALGDLAAAAAALDVAGIQAAIADLIALIMDLIAA